MSVIPVTQSCLLNPRKAADFSLERTPNLEMKTGSQDKVVMQAVTSGMSLSLSEPRSFTGYIKKVRRENYEGHCQL